MIATKLLFALWEGILQTYLDSAFQARFVLLILGRSTSRGKMVFTIPKTITSGSWTNGLKRTITRILLTKISKKGFSWKSSTRWLPWNLGRLRLKEGKLSRLGRERLRPSFSWPIRVSRERWMTQLSQVNSTIPTTISPRPSWRSSRWIHSCHTPYWRQRESKISRKLTASGPSSLPWDPFWMVLRKREQTIRRRSWLITISSFGAAASWEDSTSKTTSSCSTIVAKTPSSRLWDSYQHSRISPKPKR